MSSGALCKFVRAAVIAVAVCGLIGCGYILPELGSNIARENPDMASFYWPWLIFLWAASLPCFAILALVWKVSTAIKREDVFTDATARLVKTGSVLLFLDAGFFFAGNAILLLLNMSHFAVLLAATFVVIFAVALAVLASVLSRYLTRAAALQEEADGTR